MYEGPCQHGRYEGTGVYTYADGTRYEGQFHNGQFHGAGKLVFPNGVFAGEFKHGRKVDGSYVFNDGLAYSDDDWQYLVADRRFHSEEVIREVPHHCFDIGEGMFYDPQSGYIHDLATKAQVRLPSSDERAWIEAKCRRA